jgi:tetratricopeptide (TPR) repeat protein
MQVLLKGHALAACSSVISFRNLTASRIVLVVALAGTLCAASQEETRAAINTADAFREGIAANNLGLGFFMAGNFALAEKYYLKAASLFRETGDRRMDRRITANLATLYLETGQISKAERTIKPFVPDDRHAFAQDIDDAMLLIDLASVRMRQHRLEDAERLLQTVVKAIEGGRDDVSRETLGNALNNLGDLYSQADRLPEAAIYARRALEVFEAMPSPYRRNSVKALANLGVIAAIRKQYAESAELFQRSAELAESELGAGHPVLGEVLVRYAAILHLLKRDREAREVAQRANSIQTNSRRENALGYTVEAATLSARRR